MAASTDTAEYDWLFDYVQSVFQAPTWELPIGSFIDENCIVFDNEDENKLAYTEVHQVRGRRARASEARMGTLYPSIAPRRSFASSWMKSWSST